MKNKTKFAKLAASLAVAIGACLAPSAQADMISFNPTGTGATPVYNINGLGFGAGNALAVNAINPAIGHLVVGESFTVYYQTHLTQLTGPNAPPSVPGLNTSFQITEVAAFTETVTSVTTTQGTGTTATFAVVPNAANVINIYYNNAVTFSDANGTGFTDGKVIASLGATSFNGSNFTDTTTTAGGTSSTKAFNNTGAGNGQNATADVGSGSTNLNASVNSYNTSFFQGSPMLSTSILASNLSSVFDSVSASLQFTDPRTGTTFNPHIGSNNGTSGPDFQLQVSGFTQSFTAVPEPASLAMMGIGLAAVGLGRFAARRRALRA